MVARSLEYSKMQIWSYLYCTKRQTPEQISDSLNMPIGLVKESLEELIWQREDTRRIELPKHLEKTCQRYDDVGNPTVFMYEVKRKNEEITFSLFDGMNALFKFDDFFD